jgi:hypothetical protein
MAKRKKEAEAPVLKQSALVLAEAERARFAEAYLEAALNAVLQCVHAIKSAEVSFSSYAKRTKDASSQAERKGLLALLDEGFLGAYSFNLNHMQILLLQVTEARRRLLGRASGLATAIDAVVPILGEARLWKVVRDWASDPVIKDHWPRLVKLCNESGMRIPEAP